MTEQVGVDLRAYLRAVRKYWRLVVLLAVLGTATATFFTLRTPPTYSSTVTFFVSTPTTAGDSPLSGAQFGQQRVNSYVLLAPSERLATMVVEKSGTSLTPRQVTKRITADADVNTVLLTVHVQDGSRERSLRLAKAVSTEMVTLVDQIESQGGKRQSPVALEVVSGPTLKPYPVAPQKKKDVAAGLAVGLALGVLAAILRDVLDNTFRSPDVLRSVTRQPVLGSIGFDRGAADRPLVLGAANGTPRAEAFRQLRTGLQFINVDEPVKVLVVTSSTAQEGKSSTSANLALAFAEAGSSVLLIEADLRRPKVCDYLGLDRSVGLSNVLAGQADLDDAVQPFGRHQLMVLSSGSIPPNPSELLGTRNMIDLLARAREECDMVIIDTPPLLPVTDAAVVAAHADGALLVVRHGDTKRSHVQQSLRSLEAVGASVLGCVLTMTPRPKRTKTDGYETYDSVPVEAAPETTDRNESSPAPLPRARSLREVQDETMEMPVPARRLPTSRKSGTTTTTEEES
ncbi:polysaccharide biosynthesis tyrosine autokinase [Luteipulveratus flavus]|uniref:Polysaccharide biosynthesis tyrosine autokinase n=1 Tax=Luteipulveratus flavus TaxID=3031728 RepID=A0ABT6CC26_9MICO|nr:polysaccharide biosynthesis tyrosine autokinase [Luteipulveratus sp. YIM 133296]MDF8266467.1 polysaccharide biosynthesis tyrosine autokinase [Luteipulveratus sp. YIM 133296]